MSIKKELLDELTEKQLRELAEHKGIKFILNDAQKKYYVDWDEREILVDVINDIGDITVREIEEYLKLRKN